METVLSALLDACERAYQSKYPVIFLKTEEVEMVRRVAASDRLIVRLQRAQGASPGDLRYEESDLLPPVRPTKENALINVLTDRASAHLLTDGKMPRMFIAHVGSGYQDNVPNEIWDFIDAYTRDWDDNGALRSSVYLLYGNAAALSPELYEYCALIDVGLPGQEEIAQIVRDKVEEYGLEPLDAQSVQYLAYQLGGFTVVQAEKLLASILSATESDGFNVILDQKRTFSIIRERKEQMLRREQVLGLIHTDQQMRIGGMNGFMDWFGRQAQCITESGRMQSEMGISAPRGVLMCGVPGCGKSMAAKAVAMELGIPLLQMEVGKLMGKHVGDSEHNMDKALKLAEAMSPCVLWIDELDKGFSGAGGSSDSGDGGVFKRVFGQLLTWMQECKKPCFIFATANDITGMPKEFFRSGRFDALFAVYMPTRDECVDILKNQMRMIAARAQRQGDQPLFAESCFAPNVLTGIVDMLCTGTEPWNTNRFVTGADIEKLVNIALRSLWVRKEAKQSIQPQPWKKAMESALKTTTVYGDGTENLDSLAMCYLRLVRNNFLSVSAAQHVLFDPAQYRVKADESGVLQSAGFEMDESKVKAWCAYDRALYRVLNERIDGLALMFEQNARMRMVR